MPLHVKLQAAVVVILQQSVYDFNDMDALSLQLILAFVSVSKLSAVMRPHMIILVTCLDK
jgi:hypothetical protein